MTPITWDNHYTEHADTYELIVSHEDYQNNLVAVLSLIQPLAGAAAAEFGCGTGRVTGLIRPRVKRVHAFDLTASMLRVAQVREVVVPLFGEEMLAVLERTPEGIIVPECTGLWWQEA